MGKETYDFFVDVASVTDRAIKVTDGVEHYWIPKSQVECLTHNVYEIERGDQVYIMVQEWMAKKRGMI